MLLVDGNRRFLTIAVRSPATARRSPAPARSTGGRGDVFEAAVVDNRRLLGRGTPDSMRVVVRDPAGAVVRVIDGEVTRGDLVVD